MTGYYNCKDYIGRRSGIASGRGVDESDSAQDTRPLVLNRSSVEDENLSSFFRNNRESISKKLVEHGAILFRGFDANSAVRVEEFAHLAFKDIFVGNSEHQKIDSSNFVQVPVDYTSEQKLLWHNENTFNLSWPSKAIFACAEPAESGGQTPLADARKVFQTLPHKIRDAFFRKGIMYVRRYPKKDSIGLSWSTVFGTNDKSEVEAICTKEGFNCHWAENDTLVTKAIRPAVISHPITRELCWVNQALHWHFSCLDAYTKEALSSMYEEKDYPRNCYFANGEKIPDEYMEEILSVYGSLEVSFDWQKGDLALVDNISMAHARNPFKGHRKILVCFGDMYSFE